LIPQGVRDVQHSQPVYEWSGCFVVDDLFYIMAAERGYNLGTFTQVSVSV